mmetsp:Transcript_21766/g.41524  ORF Transcript_21766/g.41524 Transcript_21766/m.41524 type:complete len:240 (+) Transcript_21766:2445-3164(+)
MALRLAAGNTAPMSGRSSTNPSEDLDLTNLGNELAKSSSGATPRINFLLSCILRLAAMSMMEWDAPATRLGTLSRFENSSNMPVLDFEFIALESMLLLLLLLVSAAARDGCGPAPLPSSRPRPAPSYLAALTWNCNREGGRISPLARSCALPPRVSSNPSCTVSSTAAGNLGAGLWGSACSRAESTARRRAFSYTVVSVASGRCALRPSTCEGASALNAHCLSSTASSTHDTSPSVRPP